MPSTYVSALIVGVLVMLALYLTLMRTFESGGYSARKSLALFCAGAGILTTLWLNQHPDILEKYVSEIVGAGIAVVLALLIFARKSIEKK